MAKSPGTNGPKRPNPTTPPSDKTPSQSNLLFRPIVRRGGGGGGRAPSTKDVIIALNRIISKHARKGERPVMELPARGLLRYIDLNPPYRTPDKPRRDRVAGFLLRRSSRSYDDLISRLFSGAPGGGSRRGKTSARLMKPKRTIGAPPALDRRAPWFSHTDISWRSYTKILTSRSKEDTIKSERIAVAFVTWAKAEYQTEPFKCYADYESCIEGKSGALFCAGLLAICLVRSIIPGTGAAPARF